MCGPTTAPRSATCSARRRPASRFRWPGQARRPPGRPQDVTQHGGREPAGEGVALADVVAAVELQAVEAEARAVREGGARPGHGPAGRGEGGQCGLPPEGAEHDHGPQGRAQQPQFLHEPGTAGVPLLGGGFVGGRCAVHGRGDAHAVQLQAVVRVLGGRLGGEAHVVQRLVEDVPGAVAGEHPAGAVSTVGGGGESHDQQPGVRRPETGYRPGPVRPVREGRSLDPGRLLAPGDQPRAGPAVRDAPVEEGKAAGVHHSTVGAGGVTVAAGASSTAAGRTRPSRGLRHR